MTYFGLIGSDGCIYGIGETEVQALRDFQRMNPSAKAKGPLRVYVFIEITKELFDAVDQNGGNVPYVKKGNHYDCA